MYHYRVYLEDLLLYNEDVKKTRMVNQGWSSDVVGKYNHHTNFGWRTRRAKFIAYDYAKDGSRLPIDVFKDGPVTYYGPLKTNLEGCKQGLIPNTSFSVELLFNDQDFVIWQPLQCKGDYMLRIDTCRMSCLSAQLNYDIFNHLEAQLATKAAIYNYR